MPPRGWQKDDARSRELKAFSKARSWPLIATAVLMKCDGISANKREIKALSKVARGKESDLWRLIAIAALTARDGISVNKAAGKIAAHEASPADVSSAMHERLYRKFQEAPALYQRLAAAVGNHARSPKATKALVEFEASWREIRKLLEEAQRLPWY